MKRERINYGINRRDGRRIVHRTSHASLVHSDGPEMTKKMLALVRRRHPGWLLTGWCPASRKN